MKLDLVMLGASMLPAPCILAHDGVKVFTVPAGYRSYIYLAGGDFVADATVITRTLRVILDTGLGTTEMVLLGGDIVASEGKYFTLGVSSGVDYCCQLPTGGLPLGPGHRILIGETNVQAGDTWKIELLMWNMVME